MRGKKLGVIKLNPVVAARLAKDDIGVVIHPKHLPMLVEPRPWTAHNRGGYLLHSGKSTERFFRDMSLNILFRFSPRYAL